jgi:hypothetical protein
VAAAPGALAQELRADRPLVNCLLAHAPDQQVAEARDNDSALFTLIDKCRPEVSAYLAECEADSRPSCPLALAVEAKAAIVSVGEWRGD